MRAQRLVCLGLALVTSLAVAQKRREIRPGFNLFTREQDVGLGKEFSREIERQVTVVQNQPQLSTYIADLGNRLAKASQSPDYPYTFKVVAEKGINAFALPGGPIYVHAETVAAADNEAQLAGVMAHEISHVALRHSTQQVTKAYGVQIGLALAGAAIGSKGLLAQLAQLGLGFGANSLMLKYSRDAERDADILGARIMASAGFHPVEMARFFEKLEGQGGGGRGLQFLSDHPNPGNRVKYVEEEVHLMPRRSFSKGSSGFAEYRASAAKIRPAERRPAAAAPASGQPREFRGRGFRLTHPGDWEAYGSDGGGSVTIAPRRGISQNNISLGLLAGHFSARSNDLTKATGELVEDLLAKNPGIQAVRGQRWSIVLGGVRGENVVLAGNGELDTLVTAVRPEGLFYLLLISPEEEHDSLQPVFQQIQTSVRFE